LGHVTIEIHAHIFIVFILFIRHPLVSTDKGIAPIFFGMMFAVSLSAKKHSEAERGPSGQAADFT
jgi:hypothetical protein